jgi:hypothetical protein
MSMSLTTAVNTDVLTQILIDMQRLPREGDEGISFRE